MPQPSCYGRWMVNQTRKRRGPPEHRKQRKPRQIAYYADPEQPGKSRHRMCFPKGINPRPPKYQSTEGPCWVCESATQERTIYLTVRSMLDSLELVASALQHVSEQGFILAKELRCSFFSGYTDREKLQDILPDLVAAFREAWERAAQASAYPGGRRDPGLVTAAYSLLRLGYVDGRLHERDPRRYLAQLDPTKAPVVNAADIELVSGRLGNILRLIRRESSEVWVKVQANHGADEDEAIRATAAKHGGSLPQMARSALLYLEPSGLLDRTAAKTASNIADNLRHRKAKPLPGD